MAHVGSGKFPDDPIFDQAWELYPRRSNNPKIAARRAWEARLKEGESPERMLEAVKKYAEYCKQERTEPRFVKMARTFFGPDCHYADFSEWTPEDDAVLDNKAADLMAFYQTEQLV